MTNGNLFFYRTKYIISNNKKLDGVFDTKCRFRFKGWKENSLRIKAYLWRTFFLKIRITFAFVERVALGITKIGAFYFFKSFFFYFSKTRLHLPLRLLLTHSHFNFPIISWNLQFIIICILVGYYFIIICIHALLVNHFMPWPCKSSKLSIQASKNFLSSPQARKNFPFPRPGLVSQVWKTNKIFIY